MFLPVLSLTLISYTSLHSKHSLRQWSSAPSLTFQSTGFQHTQSTILYFFQFSCLWGHAENSKQWNVSAWKKKSVVFLFLFFSPEDTFCCFYSGVVQTAVSLKGQQAAAQCKDREPVLSASFLWMGSMWNLAEYSSCLSNSVKDHHVGSNACFSLV